MKRTGSSGRWMWIAGLLLPGLAGPWVAAAGTLSVLTYNVAGLPQGVNPDQFPAVNTVRISPKLNAFDLVVVQEDFAYHTELVSQVDHPYQSVKDTSGRGPYQFGFGDGLNTFSRSPFAGFTRITWDSCNGVFDQGSDCLAPKGFSMARLTLARGAEVDVYDLHADAGSGADDLTARRSNLRQLSATIDANSSGRAVLVLGDTNSRYTRSGDILPELLSAAGLTDVWIERARGGSVPTIGPSLTQGCAADPSGADCEVVDKILYRSGGGLLLAATSYAEAPGFVDDAGAPLSDHRPISAVFTYTVVPEPGAATLLAGGLLAIGARRRSRAG